MTSRWIWVAALAATVALGACKERRAPAAGSPAELVPADPGAATVEAAPTAAADTPTAGRVADAGSAARDENQRGKDGLSGEDDPSGKDRGAGKDGTSGNAGTPDKGDGPGKDGRAPAGGLPGGARDCGGVGGRPCRSREKCRYGRSAFAPQHPDQRGVCVGETYCDAPGDCEGLMHVMVVGAWACLEHRCEWEAKGGSGPQ